MRMKLDFSDFESGLVLGVILAALSTVEIVDLTGFSHKTISTSQRMFQTVKSSK